MTKDKNLVKNDQSLRLFSSRRQPPLLVFMADTQWLICLLILVNWVWEFIKKTCGLNKSISQKAGEFWSSSAMVWGCWSLVLCNITTHQLIWCRDVIAKVMRAHAWRRWAWWEENSCIKVSWGETRPKRPTRAPGAAPMCLLLDQNHEG